MQSRGYARRCGGRVGERLRPKTWPRRAKGSTRGAILRQSAPRGDLGRDWDRDGGCLREFVEFGDVDEAALFEEAVGGVVVFAGFQVDAADAALAEPGNDRLQQGFSGAAAAARLLDQASQTIPKGMRYN